MCHVGSGSGTSHRKIRTCLGALAGLAAALLGWLPEPVRAQGVPPPNCSVSPLDGSVVDCTGDLSAGVALNDGAGPFRSLNLFDLTADIAPPGSGVVFTSDGSVTLNVDAGAFRIVTTADDAMGVFGGSVNGNVSINSFADITTSGNQSHGIAAETQAGDIDIFARGSIATAGDALGPSDGAFGIYAISDTGDIEIWSDIDITTTGILGVGIFAETSGEALVYSNGNIRTHADAAAGIAVAGEAGAVVVSTGDITTFGDAAPGITVVADGDAAVVSSGNITTTGDASDGIEVISLSGTALAISFGNVSATGLGSAGIYAAGDSDAIVMNFGSVIGGPCCAGVLMDAGGTNTLLNFGTITAGLADNAIDLLAPDNVVENFGTVTGDVILSDGFGPQGTFFNHAGALFNSGDMVSATLVTNAGTLAPGGSGTIAMTLIEDDLVQTQTGVLAIDVRAGADDDSDLVVVSDEAVLAGTVAVTLTSLPAAAAQTFTILQALGGVVNEGLVLSASPALGARLFYPDAFTVQLLTSVDFAVSGLNRNETDIADNLNAAFLAGGAGLSPVLVGLLNTPGLDAYKDALDQLSPEIMSQTQIGALYSSLGFANSLLSCKVNGPDTASIIREGQCLWAGASAVFLDQGETSQQLGFNQSTGLFAAGAQVALDNVWRLGLGAGYQSSALETATGATSEGELAQGGIALKYNPGPFLLAGVVNAGHSWNDTKRPVSFGGFSGVPQSSPGIDIVNGSVRAAYVFGSPQLYLKPTLDAAATRLDLGGFTETGGGAANLTVASASQTVYTIAPSVEIGTEWWIANGTLIRPFLRGGAAWYEGGNLTLSAAFVGAPAGVAPFAIFTDMDDVMGTVGAGIDMITGEDSVLHVAYDGQLGETTQIHSVALKGSARF